MRAKTLLIGAAAILLVGASAPALARDAQKVSHGAAGAAHRLGGASETSVWPGQASRASEQRC